MGLFDLEVAQAAGSGVTDASVVCFHPAAFPRQKEPMLQSGCTGCQEGFCLRHQSTKTQEAKHENGEILSNYNIM